MCNTWYMSSCAIWEHLHKCGHIISKTSMISCSYTRARPKVHWGRFIVVGIIVSPHLMYISFCWCMCSLFMAIVRLLMNFYDFALRFALTYHTSLWLIGEYLCLFQLHEIWSFDGLHPPLWSYFISVKRQVQRVHNLWHCEFVILLSSIFVYDGVVVCTSGLVLIYFIIISPMLQCLLRPNIFGSWTIM
jgi:hypothetical protein